MVKIEKVKARSLTPILPSHFRDSLLKWRVRMEGILQFGSRTQDPQTTDSQPKDHHVKKEAVNAQVLILMAVQTPRSLCLIARTTLDRMTRP